jgi:hypothetical protein
MITGFYAGGLGNQLFQIAAGVSLALDNNDEYGLNPSLFKGCGQGHNISRYTDNIFQHVIKTDTVGRNHYVEDAFEHKPIPYQSNLILTGYFQSEKYFLGKKEVMNDLFGFSPTRSNKNAVIHVRMGDFLEDNSHCKVVTPEYFERAVELVLEHDKKISFEVVTDDPIEAQRYLPSSIDVTYSNGTELEDLHTLSQAEYCIISNSSFSWWGSYLGKEKVTIAPDQWYPPFVEINFSDVYRQNMIKVEV